MCRFEHEKARPSLKKPYELTLLLMLCYWANRDSGEADLEAHTDCARECVLSGSMSAKDLYGASGIDRCDRMGMATNAA
jgi:hypothetical protein